MRIIRSKVYYLLCFLPIAVNLVSGYLCGSAFEMLCSASSLLFLIIEFSLSLFLVKETNTKKKHPVSFFVLLPPVAIIIAGIVLLVSPGFNNGNQSYLAISMSVVLLACLMFRLISLWGDDSLVGRLQRLTVISAMSAPLSLSITSLLYLTTAEEAAALSCMTTVIFGILSFLVMANIVMISYCDYKGTVDSLKIISKAIREKRLVFARVSILKDAFLVIGKGLIGIVSVSFFMFVNALYSGGMGIARFIAVRMHTQEKDRQITSYRYVGIIISFSSLCYVLYSIRLFFGGKTGDYDMYVALVIALYTFVEFGINIKEAIKLRNSKALEAKALRAISFSSTLICFVLTQTAIMSFANEGDNSFTNALSGVVFGGFAALVGIYVVIDSISNKEKLELQ